MARGLASQPDLVRVNIIEGESVVVVELTVHEDDLPRIIGPEGLHIRAMRQLVNAASGRRKTVLELVDERAGAAEDGEE